MAHAASIGRRPDRLRRGIEDLLGFGLVPGLLVATAMSATSVGVSVAVWGELGRLRSRLGALLIDVAELDDLSAVILMLTVLAAAPALHGGESAAVVLGAAPQASGPVMAKVLVFALACFLLRALRGARYHPRTVAWPAAARACRGPAWLACRTHLRGQHGPARGDRAPDRPRGQPTRPSAAAK